MSFQVRASTRSDVTGIIELFRSAGLETSLDAAQMHWKYWKPHPDWPDPRSFVIAEGNRILAHAGVIPGITNLSGRRIRLIHAVDWAALPQATAAGVALMRQLRGMADGLLVIGGSRQTRAILPHVGFSSAGMATSYALPLRPMRHLMIDDRSDWKLTARLARRIFWSWAAPSTRPLHWKARAVGLDETQEIASLMPSAEGTAALLQSAAGLSLLSRNPPLIRYLMECPIAPVRLYALEEAGTTKGYALLSFPPGQVRIVDHWLECLHPNEWRESLRCLVALARQWQDAGEIVGWASDPILERALIECGFHARARDPIQLRLNRSDGTSIQRLRVQMIDSDAAYQHSGRANLLT